VARAGALRPDDPVTRYRHARLLQAQRDNDRALTVLEALAGARGTTPPTIYADACVDAARLLEQRGAIDRAIELYRNAPDAFGVDRRTKRPPRARTRLTSAMKATNFLATEDTTFTKVLWFGFVTRPGSQRGISVAAMPRV